MEEEDVELVVEVLVAVMEVVVILCHPPRILLQYRVAAERLCSAGADPMFNLISKFPKRKDCFQALPASVWVMLRTPPAEGWQQQHSRLLEKNIIRTAGTLAEGAGRGLLQRGV